ncbi:TIM23 complex component [Ascosphaera pollenicola]|nr:TIM23 complex component [Ascosphaera pollenicola]
MSISPFRATSGLWARPLQRQHQVCSTPRTSFRTFTTAQKRYASTAPTASLDSLLAKPTWSIKSLLSLANTQGENTVSREKLHHLLRLSALPLPSSAAEEEKLLRDLESQIRFVKEMQSVDTSDASITPLRAIRDETASAAKENEIGLSGEITQALSRENYVGRARRIERSRPERNPLPDGKTWDGNALRYANKTAGRFFVVQGSRAYSTQTKPELTTESSNAKAATTTPEAAARQSSLDWNRFFKIRAMRRRYSQASSILAAIASTGGGLQVMANQDIEYITAQFPILDPMVLMVLSIAASGGLGWLMGPFLGNGLFNLVYRKERVEFERKDKDLFSRIKAYRVDPSANSFSNPVPDYYGEKINSVQDYRRWLKDQRAYNRKKRTFI